MLRLASHCRIKVRVELLPVVDSWVFRLHYRWTYVFFILASAIATLYDVVGNKIDCMAEGSFDSYKDKQFKPFKDVVDHYCFVIGTFTVDLPHNASRALPHPGVGPMPASGEGGRITLHTYYQWVPFVLFLQGMMFYVPHLLWKRCEGGIFKEMVRELSIRDYLGDNLHNYFNKEERLEALSKYVASTFHRHKAWAYQFFVCEALSLGVVLATLTFTDWFLGGAFLSYGGSVFEAAGQDPETRLDPMSVAFPKVAKCSFRFFGPSGTVQLADVMCVIATNIVNEKIYLFLWVWLVFLTAFTCAGLLFRLLTLLLPSLRHFVLKMYTKEAAHGELKDLLRQASVSDWFLLLSFAKNMERSIFSELVLSLDSELLPKASTPPVSQDNGI